MTPTKCNQDRVNQIFRSWYRAENEGKIGSFGFHTFLGCSELNGPISAKSERKWAKLSNFNYIFPSYLML